MNTPGPSLPPPEPRWDVLFQAWTIKGGFRGGVGVWDSSSWRRVVWDDARTRARISTQIRDLRPTAASLLYVAGASIPEASEYLGHESIVTTSRHYLRASKVDWDPGLEAIRVNPTLSLQDRLDRIWEWWVGRYGDPFDGAID